MAGLEVQIGADVSGLEKGIKEAESKIKDLSKIKANKIELGLDTSDINKQISDAKKSLNELKTTLKDTGNSFASTTPKIASGGNALMNFSRIAQDAPFGIIGIGNNITATAESFGHLVKETGSAGGALKAVAGSIMGTGGILLAVSLVTTGLTYMAQNGLTVKDVFDKMNGTFDESARALSDINKEAAKTSGEEIASLKALTEVAKDNSLSMEKRLLAVKKLQDEYPAYFGNLSKEQILNGNVATAVDDVSRALIARARASAIASKLGENAAKRLELEEKREKAILEIQKAQENVENARLSAGVGGGSLLAGEILQLKRKENAYRELVQEIKDLDAQSKKYSDREAQATKDSILLLKEKDKEVKKQKTFSTPQVTGVQSSLVPGGLVDVSGKVVQIAKDVQGAEGVITTSMKNINVAFDTGFADAYEAMLDFSNSANDLIQQAITETFFSLGTMIGNSLAGAEGGLENAGNVILGILGNFMTDFGKLMIQTGVGLVVAKKMLSSGNGYAMIAAGVVLAAVGTAFASKSKAMQKGAGASLGGSSGGNYDTGANYSSPASGSSYSSGGSSFNGGNVVFEIEGQKLVGVLSNTLGRNTKLGGSLGI